MPIARRLTLSRLKTIYKRQSNPTWGGDYTPSILATRGEAPSISNAYVVRSARFERSIHLLSTPELAAFVVASYHPQLVGIQEQRMLSPEPCSHPLSNLAGEIAAKHGPLKGVIDVADRLGCLGRLPKVQGHLRNHSGAKVQLVFPYIGDFLLALKEEGGTTKCINWSIKADEAGFKRPITATGKQLVASPECVLMRHELERTYYADAGIYTHFVGSSAFDTHAINNLRFLYRYQQEPLRIRDSERVEMESCFHDCLETGMPISEVLPRFVRHGFQSLHTVLTCFYQAIWQRRLRVDLFRPIVIDRPLRREERDVIKAYAPLFTGDAPCASAQG